MGNNRRISELEVADALPEGNETVLPIFTDFGGSLHPTKRISIKTIVGAIRAEIEKGGDVTITEDEHGGIRFATRKG